ncbi:hypothetical protein N7457_000252 [Penicillium paradoxum]|uniref:uncharacterized protein n=1 Tax=Penicillium paradoxum TaxID=176176 RepID=UPI002548284C|nr:uncharacterized protein N7457_000252 [Penicillium paradoxum]KAJ5793653.1 hypothetical protein N7457_000252 [Penicillium paradoxum]
MNQTPTPNTESPNPTRLKPGPPSETTRNLLPETSPHQIPPNPPTHDAFLPGYFFFYGTLMDPPTLASIMQVPKAPPMHPARVVGYSVKMNGPYPALVWGPPEHAVDGVACQILAREHFERICGYEEGYEANPCYIEVLGKEGASVDAIKGETFIWKGDYGELRDGGV